MKENPLSHKYTEVGDKIDAMVKEDTKAGQIMETGDIVQTIIKGKVVIEAIDSEETSEGTVDKIVQKTTGTKGMVTTVEIGIGQGKESLQEVMGETEALAMIGPDQSPELVQIGIELDAMHVENMTIL